MNIRVIVTTQDAETEVTMSSPTQFSLLRLGKIGQVRFVRDQARSVLTPLLLIIANSNRNLHPIDSSDGVTMSPS